MWAPRHLKLKIVAFPTLAYPLPVIQIPTEAFIFSDEVRILRLLLLCLPQNAPSIFGKANILMSKLSCCYWHVNTGGVCPLAFPETTVVWLPYSQNIVTLSLRTIGEEVPYPLYRDTYIVETEVCFLFSTALLTIVQCSVLRKREMREAFVSQLLLGCFRCIKGCGSQRWIQSW